MLVVYSGTSAKDILKHEWLIFKVVQHVLIKSFCRKSLFVEKDQTPFEEGTAANVSQPLQELKDTHGQVFLS